jgi:ATP phosphoribosyltransferase
LLEGAGGGVCFQRVADKTPLLMLGLPKGSLEESTKNLFAKAGWKITTSSRSYRPSIDDPELDGRFVRAQEVSRYVEHGFFDCGLTGYDWIQENNSDVVEVCDLVYSRASTLKSRWVLCVPEASPVRSAADLAGKRVATELVNTTRRYFEDQGVKPGRADHLHPGTVHLAVFLPERRLRKLQARRVHSRPEHRCLSEAREEIQRCRHRCVPLREAHRRPLPQHRRHH